MSEKTSAASSQKNANPIVKNALGIVGAVLGGFIIFYLLPSADLTVNARALAGLFVGALILWVTEAFDPAVTSLLTLALMPLLGVFKDLKSATVGFYGTIVFFVIASFVLSTAVERSGIGKRFALSLLSKTKSGSKVAVLIFMVGCSLTSMIMSDVPSAAIWMSLAMPILNNLNLTPGKSNFGKAIMIGIPIGSLTGGVATPAGSSINILAINLMAQGGVNVSFFQWMAIGLPVALIMTFVGWFILVKVFPPEVVTIGTVDEFKNEYKALGKWSKNELKTVAVMAIALFFWIGSSWIKGLDITMVAILAAVAMFIPGMGLFSWKDAQNSIGWGTILLIGVVSSLGAASVETGLSKWIVGNVLGGVSGLSLIVLTLIIAAFTIVIHIPIPINPAIIAAIIPPMLALAQTTGINGAIYALPVAFTTSAAFLLPLDAVTLVTYSKGYYGMKDMFFPGLLISMVWCVVVTFAVVLMAPIVGLR